MNRLTKQVIEDVLTLGVILCLTGMTVVAILDAVYPNVPAAMEREAIESRVHLPSKCREFYNTSTDEWQRCMMVEKR
jgi:sensor domain CHASE-containing protein